MSSEIAKFEGWAIVELMGHRKLAGHVSEVTIAGASMLRLDVPSDPPVTHWRRPGRRPGRAMLKNVTDPNLIARCR